MEREVAVADIVVVGFDQEEIAENKIEEVSYYYCCCCCCCKFAVAVVPLDVVDVVVVAVVLQKEGC